MTSTVYIGKDAIAHLLRYCQRIERRPITLIADQNTYRVSGEDVERALTEHDFDIQSIVLTGEEILANERYLMQVFVHTDSSKGLYLAVGSGTITDITRFVSHRSRCEFISIPTAPSVDGFTSIVAPLVVEGNKITPKAHPPIAVFADIDVLCTAPKSMIAAGFGDMIGKYTSLADWKLDHLLWGAPFDEAIAARVRKAVDACAEYAAAIRDAGEEGVRHVLEGLIESGFCMVEFGTSQPASGGEHHLSHYWEMKLLQDGKPAILHGAKVGVGTVHAARRYEALRQMSRPQLMDRLEQMPLPDREDEIAHIRDGYGPVADQVIAIQAPFLNLTEAEFSNLKQRVGDLWDTIQDIAREVPPPQEIVDLLAQVGGPTNTKWLGLDQSYLPAALKYAHYLRDNLTINKLSWLLGIE
jgi:glycerol-1-phosphate dehydrogenase [NAD(P)+]